jgi:nicotinate dehydrogenase subunit A
MTEPVTLVVDGISHTHQLDPAMPLLYALRNTLNLKNPRFGCGLGQCGLCTVIVNGRAIRSCITPVSTVHTVPVTTLAGISQSGEPHPVQQAFIEKWAAQCGYCLNGWIMTAVALLDTNPQPSDSEIRSAFSGLKCRCAMQMRYISACKHAADIMQQASLGGTA